jgi:hypothetical protein
MVKKKSSSCHVFYSALGTTPGMKNETVLSLYKSLARKKKKKKVKHRQLNNSFAGILFVVHKVGNPFPGVVLVRGPKDRRIHLPKKEE